MKKVIIIFIILTIILNSVPPNIINEKYIMSLFYRNNIDLDSKSYKGWIRLINSDRRLAEYNYYFSKEEKIDLIKFLRIKIQNKKTRTLK